MAKDDPVELFRKRSKRADDIVEATRLAYSDAYIQAAKKHLQGDNDEELDYDKLDDADTQEKFADEVSQHLYSKAKSYFKSDVDGEDALKSDPMMRAYAGTTKAEVLKSVRSHGKSYSLNTHEQSRDETLQRVRQELKAAAGGHLKEEHKKGLIKDMDFVDPDKMTIDDAIQVAELYRQNKGLTKDQLKEIYQRQGQQSPIYLK
jgi:hypothetical protein